MPTTPLLLKSLSTVTTLPTAPPTPSPLFYMTQLKIRGRALPLRPPSAGGTPTYIHECPATASASAAAHPDKLTYMLALPPRPPPLLHTQIYIRTCVPNPRARPPLAAHPDTHTNIPALHPDIHSFGTQGSVCFTACAHIRQVHTCAPKWCVAVGTPSNPAGHFELLAAKPQHH